MQSFSRCRLFCGSTIGQKYIVAVTGLLLCGFVLMHMSGNLLILVSAEAYNQYSHGITHNPWFLYSAEVILTLIFVFHLSTALRLAMSNRVARGITPSKPQGCSKLASFASRSMGLTGVVILVFLVWHLKTFRFGTHYSAAYGGVEMRDLHRLIVEEFTESQEVAIYLIALAALWLHISHGVSALFQTLGLSSSKSCCLRWLALGYATLVALGFAVQPLSIYLKGGH